MRVDSGKLRTASLGDAIRAADGQTIERIAAAPIIPLKDNLVHRPWGGRRLGRYKGLSSTLDRKWGESFEICASSADEEAAAHSSVIRLADGSEVSLPSLLAAGGAAILGDGFVALHGCQIPVLPKTLDIAELLSVQAHPEGFTEVYIILEADEGATIRLGFSRDVDAEDLGDRLKEGRLRQLMLLDHLGDAIDLEALQAVLAGNFSDRAAPVASVLPALEPLAPAQADWTAIAMILETLKGLYWEVLGLLNEIPVAPGQVIYNANPGPVSLSAGRSRSAEVHALGNPQGRRILALEVQRPGRTLRAWDHVRFPLRTIEVDKALDALNLRATQPDDFFVTPQPVAGRPGVFRSIEDAFFTVDHLRPRPGADIVLPDGTPVHTLHAIHGKVALQSLDGRIMASLDRGESALIPAAMGGYRQTTADCDAEVVMVTIPF